MIEIIGVLAIMATLMALITPSILEKIDAASREGEDGSLQGIAEAVETLLQENRAWPSTLSDLSPNYTSFGSTQLTQNWASFPRYYVPHPTMSSFSNAAGLDPSDLDDARYLLISNLASDAAPTITNATEFNTWWNTDETGTPDLKIYRGNIGRMFRLLSLTSNGIGGSYTIDGTTTNPGCSVLADHTRYHLHGTPVGLDEAGTYATPEVKIGLEKDSTYQFHCGLAAGSQWRKNHGPKPYCWSLWLTTNNDVSGSGAPCLDSWADGEIIQFGDPNLAFEPGTTSGTFSSAVNLEGIALDGNLGTLVAIHYVMRNITVGTSTTYDLLAGDLLFAHHSNNEEITPPYIWSDNWELIVFRPDTPGDYSAGTLYLLLNDFAGGHVHSISLVETDTVVGDTTLLAGTFLYSTSGSGKNDIFHFAPTSVGGTTSGTTSTLLDGSTLGIASNNEVHGMDLIETTLNIGDTTLAAGTILVTLKNDEAGVGSNSLSTKKQDIFYLDVTSTEMGSGGTSTATATLLLEGADVGLNTNQEDLRGISVAPTQ